MYNHGGSFLAEADVPRLVTMPHLLTPKLLPMCLFIPNPEPDDLAAAGGGSFVIMDRNPKLEVGCGPQQTHQFEGLICHKRSTECLSYSWSECTPIPPPPYDRNSCSEIRSYALVDGISQISISMESAGTFSLDMASFTWKEEGKWMLPFYGKFEYVPELKLWFGFSEDRLLVAADLSTMDSQPRLLGTWKEFEPPEGWQEMKDPQLVNLGSGRFCVTRFFRTRTQGSALQGILREPSHRNVAVLTGVEVMLPLFNGNGNRSNEKVELVVHISRYHKSSMKGDTIAAVV